MPDNNAEYGYYIPSYFHMRINSLAMLSEILEPLQNCKTPHNDEKVLFHEYIHFLQDIGSTIGLINLSNTINIIKGIAETILSSESAVEIPIDLNSLINYKINNSLFEIYIGDVLEIDDMEKLTIREIQIEKTSHIFKGKKYEEFGVIIILDLKFQQMKGVRYKFGSKAIMESISAILQQKIYGDFDFSTFPYNACLRVAQYIIPGFAKKEILLQLAEISLLSYNPGRFFYDSLMEMKKLNYDPKDLISFREWLLNFVKVHDPFENVYLNIRSLFSREVERAKGEINDLLPGGELGNSARWINGKIDALKAKLFSGWTYNAYFTQDPEVGRLEFLNTLTEIGTPLVMNFANIGELVKGQREDEELTKAAIYFPIIDQFYRLFTNNDRSCLQYEFCCELIKDKLVNYKVNENCKSSPWQKILEEEKCPFAILWITWGFSKLQIK